MSKPIYSKKHGFNVSKGLTMAVVAGVLTPAQIIGPYIFNLLVGLPSHQKLLIGTLSLLALGTVIAYIILNYLLLGVGSLKTRDTKLSVVLGSIGVTLSILMSNVGEKVFGSGGVKMASLVGGEASGTVSGGLLFVVFISILMFVVGVQLHKKGI